MKLPQAAVILLLLALAALVFRPFDAPQGPGGVVNSLAVLALLVAALVVVLVRRRR